MSTTLIIPGLGSSGHGHWQTWLEGQVSGARRVVQRNWNDASLPEWASRVRREIVRTSGPVFLVAHSFGALAAVQAAHDHAGRIAGVLLVAPADPETFGVEDVLPCESLSFPAIVVASTNDPWMTLDRAALWSERWGAELVNLGEAGHINAQAGFGAWPQALELLKQLRQSADFRLASQRLAARLKAPPRSISARRRSPLAFGQQVSDYRDLDRAAAHLRAAGWSVKPPGDRVLGAR